MKICLIGSTRFIDDYHRLNRELTLQGHVVYSVATTSTSGPRPNGRADRIPQPEISDDEKETLDLVHLLKIQNSDVVVLVTDSFGYVGESTKREVKWALLNGKHIVLPHQIADLPGQRVKFYEWVKKELADVSTIKVPGR